MSPEQLLLSAIAALAAAVVALYGLRERDNRAWRRDQKEATRLIYALLGRVHELRGSCPSSERSEWDEDTKVSPRQFDEAKQAVRVEVNGDLERLVRRYLESEPPPSI